MENIYIIFLSWRTYYIFVYLWIVNQSCGDFGKLLLSPKSVPVSVLFSTWIEQFASWNIGNSVNWVYISLESKQTNDWPQLLGCS